MQQHQSEGAPIHMAIVTLQKINTGTECIASRINIENTQKLKQAGLSVGTRIDVSYEPGCVKAIKSENGSNIISPKKNRRRDGSIVIGERLDLRSSQIAANFAGKEKILSIYFDGQIVFLHLPSVSRSLDRAERLKSAIANRRLKTAALYSGVGTLDAAMHEGLGASGIETQLAFVNDSWDVAIDALLSDNPAANQETVSFTGGIEEFIANGQKINGIDMAVLGILCKGASKLNVATRDLPEMHPIAGHQVINAMMALQLLGFPPLVLVENVLAWADTISYSMLVRVLHEQGYQTQLVGDYNDEQEYKGLNSNQYGDIERRVRMALLAYPQGITLNFEGMVKTGFSTKTVGDIRLPEHLVDPSEYDKGLHLNSEHKLEKGWKNRIVADTDVTTPSLSAECWKQRVEDPKFVHPSDRTKCRLPLPEEHCSLKGHSLSLINSIPENSHAHTVLGNGTAKKCWVEFARVLGTELIAGKSQLEQYLRQFWTEFVKTNSEVVQADLFA